MSRGTTIWRDGPPADDLCEVRVLSRTRELVDSYRLRYLVYGGLGYVRGPFRAGLEIDEYDGFSISFGAFVGGDLVGTLRLIRGEHQPAVAARVDRVIRGCADPELAELATRPRRFVLPSIVSGHVMRQIESFNPERMPLCELSRTIVHPDYRGAGVSRSLMELGLAYASQEGPVVLVGGCLPEHVPMYARYGYTRLSRTGLDLFDSVGQIAHAVVCRTDALPEPTRCHVDELVRLIRAGAATCLFESARGATLHRLTRLSTVSVETGEFALLPS
jgi:predicted GNAT family N-acyltransferase